MFGALLMSTRLYLIEILHQTTTPPWSPVQSRRCILSKFYIKPQHFDFEKRINYSCILSKFYIKPQPAICNSNLSIRCILSKFYIKPQPVFSYGCRSVVVSYRNSTSNHNTPYRFSVGAYVVSYRNSTSNHNTRRTTTWICVLYLIEILHQTTTMRLHGVQLWSCILSKFYIKPQQHFC